MKFARPFCFVLCCSLLAGFLASGLSLHSRAFAEIAPPTDGSWYFAVSGDSRDCGDLIMPMIASSVLAKTKKRPLKFYWHLGDFRAFYRIDCDWAKSRDAKATCAQEGAALTPTPEYQKAAWQDFIDKQMAPFKPFESDGITVYLGIGNHELIKTSRKDFRETFKEWLNQPAIDNQRKADRERTIPSKDGDTYFHFVMNGVDFITLDNANLYNNDPMATTKKPDPGFSEEQLDWLRKILEADKADNSVKAVVVGMHAALPESISQRHAMDRTCESFCSGKRAYAMIEQVQSAGKQVLVLASHSHYKEPDAYKTAALAGHVLPGWIIGTAGAEQYRPAKITYGYLLVKVMPNGKLIPKFQEVKRDPGDKTSLTTYCFEKNQADPNLKEEFVKAKDCTCKVQ